MNSPRGPASAQEIAGLSSQSAFLGCLQRYTDNDTDTDLTIGRAHHHHHPYAPGGPRRYQRGASDRDDDHGVATPPPPSPWLTSRSGRLPVLRAPAAPAAAATAVAVAAAVEAACGSGVRADYGGVRSVEELLLRVEASARAVSREKDDVMKVYGRVFVFVESHREDESSTLQQAVAGVDVLF